jgi:hypothetical protein
MWLLLMPAYTSMITTHRYLLPQIANYFIWNTLLSSPKDTWTVETPTTKNCDIWLYKTQIPIRSKCDSQISAHSYLLVGRLKGSESACTTIFLPFWNWSNCGMPLSCFDSIRRVHGCFYPNYNPFATMYIVIMWHFVDAICVREILAKWWIKEAADNKITAVRIA